MPPYASPPMASWLRNEVVFPPLRAPVDWSYAPRNFRPSSSPAAPRHAPNVIIPIRSQPCAFSSPGIFSSNSLAARLLCTAPLIIYNTVVLGAWTKKGRLAKSKLSC